MPEGDAIHRAARRLQVLVGQKLEVETPHPRAAVKQLGPRLDGRRLESVEAIGKNLLFRFEGRPSSPLEELVLCDATAVTAFRNGRGIVSLVRDGRSVQFSAQLIEAQAAMEVRVGDRLRVEDLDAQRERLTVSVPQD